MKNLLTAFLLSSHCFAADLSRPQEPKGPFPYLIEEVSYRNEIANTTLSGTLTLPSSKGPFPVLLLIQGSGPLDRDETILGHKPFWVLADDLARHGIGCLRYDKRGIGGSTGSYSLATTADFAEDALAAVAFLKSRPEVAKIGLLGHSEGGLIAPMVAMKTDDIAWIILMAAPGVSGEEILMEQTVLALKAQGANDEEIAFALAFRTEINEAIKEESDPRKGAELCRKIGITYQVPEENLNLMCQCLESQWPWFRYFLSLDPAVALKQVHVPTLVLTGDLDWQVSADQNLPAIAKAFDDGGFCQYEVARFARLNHLFQTCATGSVLEYGEIEETISPEVLSVIASWVREKK